MGYTHYWHQHRTIDIAEWKAIQHDFQLLERLPRRTDTAGGFFAEYPLEVAFEDDQPTVPPRCDEDVIRFNGIGALGHETFLLERAGAGFAFCKTARKPYDLLVCATLIVANTNAPGALAISSDGSAAEWAPAVAFVQRVLDSRYQLPDALRVAGT